MNLRWFFFIPQVYYFIVSGIGGEGESELLSRLRDCVFLDHASAFSRVEDVEDFPSLGSGSEQGVFLGRSQEQAFFDIGNFVLVTGNVNMGQFICLSLKKN